MANWHFEAANAVDARAVRPQFVEHLRFLCTPTSDIPAAEIVFGELVSNVIRHAPGPIQIMAKTSYNGFVTLCVWDQGDGFTLQPRLPDRLSEGGRGLYIILSLCRNVTVHRTAEGPNEVCVVLPVIALAHRAAALVSIEQPPVLD